MLNINAADIDEADGAILLTFKKTDEDSGQTKVQTNGTILMLCVMAISLMEMLEAHGAMGEFNRLSVMAQRNVKVLQPPTMMGNKADIIS